ncbi:hypothetical protein FDW83_11220 [Pseudarthrobacter sp. NamE2]|uniref:hypothetical protein n=1 Tax=Pseudarthrobacter sp. NamE2 TaxID=2576838 RepID=UPI0010FE0FF1|nr:hypothetical protein [Pseudarthrobacter sp. NamE2]TLM82961.1 hypothetical protein FDW83_11220 [Pseudarthrobacter sp. NamE2]
MVNWIRSGPAGFVQKLQFQGGVVLPLVSWAIKLNFYFTRASPYKSNDNSQLEPQDGMAWRAAGVQRRFPSQPEIL